jgi:hypothetical protein
MKFRKKPVVIEAITFAELVDHGRASTPRVRGTVSTACRGPSTIRAQPITHENDDCYLIPTLEGTMRFERGDMLITA